MDESEKRLEIEAFEYIKSNRKALIEKFAPLDICKSVAHPISLFMAGSPGAGKTEVSVNLIKQFKNVPIRIDADEIRKMCEGYTGLNAHVFQKAANKGVNILFDYALDKRINLILDGTFAYAGALDNIRRSLARDRKVELWFVYQDPLSAWKVTKARERKETRHVSKDVFIRSFFDSRKNVEKVKNEFGNEIQLNLLIKDYQKGQEDFKLNISAKELDGYIGTSYTEDDLQKLLL